MEHMKWAKTKYEEIKKYIEPILEEIGFLKHNTQFIPASGLNAQNILKPVSKTSKSVCDWYHGESLVDTLNHQIVIKNLNQE